MKCKIFKGTIMQCEPQVNKYVESTMKYFFSIMAPVPVVKKEKYMSWDTYFMSVALLIVEKLIIFFVIKNIDC